ncbi:MAG: PQQ-dependent sugar dehydrogenase, partial [Chthoniobacteraceae bacterium]
MNFAVEDVLTNLEQPMAVRFFPDGRMLVIQKKGIVRIVNVLTSPIQSDVYMNLADPSHAHGLDSDQERGLLDIAIDPNFSTSPYVYVLYTPATGPNGPRLRVGRFTHVANSNGVTSRGNMASELIVWQDTQSYDSCCHFGGGLDFGPDGRLFLTTGDHFQGSYATNRQMAGGKVHRINKDGSIPPGNPYADGTGPNMDSIFAYGLRNPFRARWDLPSGRFFIGEVGGNTQSIAWEDLHVLRYLSSSGRFVDADLGTASDNNRFDGINYGWPTVEGLPPHTNFPGAVIDAAMGEPIFAWRHSGITSAITGGVVYRGTVFPAQYQGAYFYADSTRDFIRYLRFATNGSLIPNPSPAAISSKNPDTTSYPFDLTPLGRVVALESGPGGALYYVSFTDSGGAFGEPNPAILGAVRRYVYDNGNVRPAIAEFSATPLAGPSPLAVTFRIRASDPNNNPMTYVLRYGDGTTSGAPQPLPANTLVTVTRTYTTHGVRQAVLEVMDASLTATQSLSIKVGTPPSITSLTSSNSRPGSTSNAFRFGDVITFTATATDPQDGTMTGANFSWSIAFIRPGNTHPAFGPQTGAASINFPIPSQGQGFSGPVYYRCFLTVTDSSGLSTSSSIDIFPEKSNITFDTVPSGIVVQVDGNTARATPFVLDTLINFNHLITVPSIQCINGTQYDFTGWSNGALGAQQIYNVPATDSSLTASYAPGGPCAEPPASGLVMRLTGNAGVVVSGANVLSWEDQTTFYNDLGAVGGPTLLSSGPNSEPAVHFDGVDDALFRTGFTGLPTGAAARSLFMVVRYNAANASTGSWAGFSYGTYASAQMFGLALTPSGTLGVQGFGSFDVPSNPPASGVGAWLTHSAVYSGGTLNQFKNGNSIGTASQSFSTGTSSIRLGEELNGGKNLDMDVAEVLVYNRAVSEVERLQIEGYFSQRYAIATAGGNTAPAVSITAPSNGSSFATGTTVTFTATADDVQQGNLSAGLNWVSSLNGPIGTGASISVSSLSAGNHTITALVADSGGLVGTAGISVTISAPSNTAPVVAITAPSNGASFASGATVTVTGTANDAQQGNMNAAINWTSSIDGPLGTGASLSVTTLSVGTHAITAAVTDSGGLTGAALVNITVTLGGIPGLVTSGLVVQLESDLNVALQTGNTVAAWLD